MKSIKTKLIVLTSLLVLVIILGITICSIKTSTDALMNTSDTMLSATVEEASQVIQSRISSQLTLVQQIASSERISDASISVKDKLKNLELEVQKYDFIKIGIADASGQVQFTNDTSTDISQRDYFQKALKGTANVAEPLMSNTEKKMVVVYAVPINVNGQVAGVLTATKDGNDISGLVNDITVGKTGRAFMLNAEGVKIAHYDNDLVVNRDNDFENVKKDKSLKGVLKIEKKMIDGKKGVGVYSYRGKEKFLAYTPVTGTSWSIAIAAEKDDILSELDVFRASIIVIAVVAILLSAVVVFLIANVIAKNIKTAINYIKPMSNGDFSTVIAEKDLKIVDEVGEMIRAIDTTQKSIKGMLQTVTDNSKKIDMDATSLSAVSEQMSASSTVVADAIQEVAKGTISQSDALILIADGMNEFSRSVEHIAEDVSEVDKKAKDIILLAEESNANMKNLSSSVDNTNRSFSKFETGITNLGEHLGKINEITNLINSISEQTNLLSLNAAIEAARAGEAGKGFAVVADEIRKLAEQSTDSVSNISSLIDAIYAENDIMVGTSKEVSKEFADQAVVIETTLTSFNRIIESVEIVIPKIGDINLATESINKQKNEIMGSIDDISAISQENSASSEEITASSEEMNSSAEEVANSAVNLGNRTREMMEEVNKFKLD